MAWSDNVLKCSVESRDTVLNTWEVELYKVIAENGKLNYDFNEIVVQFAVFSYYFVKLYLPGIEHCITGFNATL